MIHVRCARLASKKVNEHWQDTVLKNIELNNIKDLLTSDQLELFNDDREFYNFWGDKDATLKKTKRIETGEQIVFYGENKFHLKAVAGPTFVNEDLADYFWPTQKDELPWKNIYVLNEITDLQVPYVASDLLLKDGTPRKATNFQSGAFLEDFQLTNEFKSKLEIGWVESSNSDEHTRRGIPRDAFIKRAQIYKVSFRVNNKNLVYIGQDLKCEDDYYGSSLVIYHYRKLYGDSIFNKEIIDELYDLTKGEVNDLENYYIKEEKKRLENMIDTYSINYTGENQR